MGVFIKSKKEKQEEAELKEFLDQIEKEEKEVDEELGKIEIKDLFKKDPLEEELKSYMTPEQLERERIEKRESDIFSFITGGIFLTTLIALIVLVNVFSYVAQDDLHKVELVNIQNYYKDRYGSKPKIDDIKYYCYKDKERNDVCTDIIYATTSENEVIMKLNDTYGDNVSTSKYYDEYNKYFSSINPSIEIIMNNPSISDIDFNPDFHKYTSQAKVMPANDSFNNLLLNKKLIISDMIMYQGDLDLEGMKQIYNYLNEDSKFVFVKMNKGIPSNVKIITYDKLIDLYVTGTTYPDQGITNYQLDTAINAVSDVYVTKLSPNSITPLNDDYEFTNGYSINLERGKANTQNKDDIQTYYLIMFDSLINGDNLYEINAGKELDPASYKEYFSTYFGGKTFIVANTNLSLGNKSKIQKGIFN